MLPLLVALLALVEPVAGLTAAEVRSALGGEVPTRTETFTRGAGDSAGRGLGAIVIERPLARVWVLLTHFDDKAEYMPRLDVVRVLDRRPDALRARFEVDATITTAVYTAWFYFDGGASAIRWRLDGSAADNTIRDTEGEYRLVPLSPDRTLLVYRVYVDSGRIIPRFIQNYLARRAIPNLLRAIKARVETDGLYRKR